MKKVYIYIYIFLFLLVFGNFTKDVFAISDTPDLSFPDITHVSDIVYDSVNDIFYISGSFTNYNGEIDRDYLIALNGSDGSLVEGFNPIIDNSVGPLYLSGTTLYVSGKFTSVGGESRNYFAAINTFDGSVTSFNPNLNGEVFV